MCRRPSSFVRVISVCALLFFIMGCATARRFANTPQHLPLPEAFTAATHAVHPGDGWLSTFADKPLTALVKEALTTHSDIRLAVNRIRSARIASGDAAASDDPRIRQQYMEGIAGDLDELDAMVGELLLYARFDREQPELFIEEIPTCDWANAIFDRMDPMTSAIRIQRDLSGAPDFLIADARHLTRAVENLLFNAIRHARSRVRLTITGTKTHVYLKVEDDGPGIPAEDRLRIFEPFVRLDESRSRDSGGHGLGLAIVKRIMDWHEGSAFADTIPDGGARFTLKWPSG